MSCIRKVLLGMKKAVNLLFTAFFYVDARLFHFLKDNYYCISVYYI